MTVYRPPSGGIYIPASAADEWLPVFQPEHDDPPPWFICAFPHGGMQTPSRLAGPNDRRCDSVDDGLQCDRVFGHYDRYSHRASWDGGAFTMIWGGSI